jgi:hypothetical protein
VPLTPGGTSTSFNWGVKATTTDANGVATIAHGLGVVPSTVLCVQQAGSGGSGTNYICRPNSGSYTATNFSFVAKSDAGAVLVSAAITVMWFVGQ